MSEQLLRGEQDAIEQHLRANAGRYCSQPGDGTAVVLLRSKQRAATRLYWYRVGALPAGRTVVVKVPGDAADRASADVPGRPRLAEPPALAGKYAREHQALHLLESHFSDLDEHRFGVVPLLGRIDPARAIVMGEIQGRPMNSFLPQLSRIYPGAPSHTLRRAVENAGAWLRAYHQLTPGGTRTRQAHRDEIVELAHRFCNHLGTILSQPSFFGPLAGQLADAARRLFPPELSLGLGHGDFAMRNVLVGAGGKVFVFDTSARWLTPVYEDLAKFGLAMRLTRAQVYSRGLAFSEDRLRAADGWLFAGYFGEEAVPEEQIRLYGLLLLLDKWSFELALPPRGPTLARAAKRQLLNSWFASQARAMVRRLA